MRMPVVMRICLFLLAIILLGARCEDSQVGVVHQELAKGKHPSLRSLQGGGYIGGDRDGVGPAAAFGGCGPAGAECFDDTECCSFACTSGAGSTAGFCTPTREDLLNDPSSLRERRP
mmetsp:Transcript_33229/g.82239  ORF Transcript_33229/g.82239 Transcript_33229/m.82239 type:complete len:117 (+) Transcript_33229:134-484(+)